MLQASSPADSWPLLSYPRELFYYLFFILYLLFYSILNFFLIGVVDANRNAHAHLL